MDVRIVGIGGIPVVGAGDDVGEIVAAAAESQGTPIQPGEQQVTARVRVTYTFR